MSQGDSPAAPAALAVSTPTAGSSGVGTTRPAAATTMTPSSSASSSALSKHGVVRLDAEYAHSHSTPVAALFTGPAAAALGRSDFTAPLRILGEHLVATVGDLRLLVQENQLRELGLPIRLCVWIEEEIAKLEPTNHAGAIGVSVSIPTTAPLVLPPIPLSEPVTPTVTSPVPAAVEPVAPTRSGAPTRSSSIIEKAASPRGSILQPSVSNEDLNSTLVDEDDFKDGTAGLLATLTGQLANLSFVDGLPKGATAAAAAAAANATAAAAVSSQPQQHTYTYSSDFDRNGIIWALATRNSTQAWVNPMDAGYVSITASSLMDDSVPLSAVVGRDTVRCVTKPLPNSWICLDFGPDMRLIATHYTLRHYSSWDTEALRSWRVESSLNGQDWSMLREHHQDENLSGKGGTFTWSLSGGDIQSARKHQSPPWRFLRLLQTGENSNKHHYLACSGLELYGRVFHADGVTPYNFANAPAAAAALTPAPSAAAAPSVPAVLTFKHASPFDTNGILHYLATGGNSRAWTNPAEAGLVHLAASSLNDDSEPLSAIVGRATVRCVSQPLPDQWFALDFGPGRLIQPSAYSLRHYSSWDTEALRNWRFEGSTDSGNPATAEWVLISEHRDDSTLSGRGSTGTWHVQTTRFFRMFRIHQVGQNSNKHHYLACSGFELYGTVKTTDAAAQPMRAMSLPVGAAPTPNIAARPSSLAPHTPHALVGGAVTPVPAALAASAATPAPQLDSWDPQQKGVHLEVLPATPTWVRNPGSADKWQLVRGRTAYSSGIRSVSVRIQEDPNTSNTWRFILGLVPATLDCTGAKQWVGVNNSWGYISGTGGKCHNTAVSVAYGARYTTNDVITIVMDFTSRTIGFYKNDLYQGTAFTDLVGPVHLAASLTGTGSALMIVPTPPIVAAAVASLLSHPNLQPAAIAPSLPIAPPAAAASELTAWDPMHKSAALTIDAATGYVRNTGSNDKWQSVRSVRAFSAATGSLHRFDVELVDTPKTNNSWQVIVGVVPPTFTCTGSKQWVGAGESFGYIGGTGGKCFNAPKSLDYGEKYAQRPGGRDVITVQLDFGAGTIEFLKNGVSQGIAFTNLTGTVYAAVSLTATGATARLQIHA